MPNGEKLYTYDELTTALANAGRAARADPNNVRARQAAEHFAGMIDRQEYEERSKWYETGLQALGQGATFGLADELGAGVRAALVDPAIAAIVQDKRATGIGGLGDYFTTMGERYDKALAEQREAVQTAREEDPYQMMAGELIGGLAQGGIGTAGRLRSLAAAGKPATTMQGIKESAKVAAGVGAATEYGMGEGDAFRELTRSGLSADTAREFGEAVSDAGRGAALGATMGVALPGGAALARGLTRSVRNVFKPSAKLTEEGKASIRDALMRDIESGYITSEEEALEMLRDTPGMSAADLGPHLRRVLKDVTTSGTAAGTRLQQELTDRNREAWARVIPRLNKIVGSDKGYFKTLATMQAETRKNAKEAYDKAYATTISMTPEMVRFLGSKEGKKVLKRVNDIREIEGRNLIDKKTLKVGQERSLRDMDDVLQAMDDRVGAGFKKGYNLGKALKNQRDQFRQGLYDQNEEFRLARQQFGTDKSREEAMEMGNKIFREDVDMVKEMFEDMPQAEREDFVVGMMGAIERQMKGKPDDADILKGLFNIQGRREIMDAVLGDSNKFEEIMRFVKNESKMFDTYKKAVPGTDTAENLMKTQTDQQGRIAGMLAFAASKSLLVAGMASRAARLAGRARGPSPAEQYLREQQSEMLMSGAEGLQQAMQRPTGLLGTGAQPIPATMAAGLMATGPLHQPEQYGGY